MKTIYVIALVTGILLASVLATGQTPVRRSPRPGLPDQAGAAPRQAPAVMEQFDVRRFGADSTGRRDSARAIQSAIDTLLARRNASERLLLPAGDYRLDRPIVIKQVSGLVVQGAGSSATRSRGWDPVRRGTRLIWGGKGPPDGAMIRLIGTNAIAIRDLSLWGSVDTNARAGTLLRTEFLKGYGNSGLVLDNVGFLNAEVGFQAGVDNKDNNCDGAVFIRPVFNGLNIGFRCATEQGLDFAFVQPSFGQVGTAFDFERGGAMHATAGASYGVQTILRVANGGGNAGTYTIDTFRADGPTRTQFFVGGDGTIAADFRNCSNVKHHKGDTPLFDVRSGNVITVSGGRYFGDSLFRVAGAGKRPGRIRVDGVSLHDGLTVDGQPGGRWKVTDCYGPDELQMPANISRNW